MNVAREFLKEDLNSPDWSTLWSVLCRRDMRDVKKKVYDWLEKISKGNENIMRKILIQDERDDLRECFDSNTLTGFKNNLKSSLKKDQDDLKKKTHKKE